ncbi:hypothetical protein LUZ60_004949 [Juncus effusus]|nr:hypothetical protein LUZ60_004949 [Juncus effusus]
MAYYLTLHTLRSTIARINFFLSDSPNHLPSIILDDLRKLEEHIIRTSEVFGDAEKRSSLDRSVELWLGELKEIAYHAEDLVDDYCYEVLRVQNETFHPVSKLVTSDDFAVRLTKVLERFKEISGSVSALQLMREDGDRPSVVIETRNWLPISLGREHVKKTITDFLLSSDDDSGSISVLSIVGPAGVGKTRLAQLVYNDRTISSNFNLQRWADVSEGFCITTITRNLLQSFGKKTCNLKDQTRLQKELMKELMGKKYFIVLDDVCLENASLWECFLAPFRHAQSGKIIITTCSTSTAKIVQATLQVSLECLNFEDSWSMFQNIAFRSVDVNSQNKLEIGRNIAAKCGGVPLYIEAVASALRLDPDERNWESILERWREGSGSLIDAAFLPLKMCYAAMPIKLKQCFLFLSMYPRGHVFLQNTLLKFWMSLGPLEEKGNEPKDIGKESEYVDSLVFDGLLHRGMNVDSLVFDGLLHRGMIQLVNEYRRLNFGFVMHDLVHDFARFVAGKEFSAVKHDCLHEISTDVGYLSIILPNSPETVDLQPLKRCRHLRVLQILNQGNTWKYGGVKFTIPPEIFPLHNQLRCLILRDTHIEILPDSIGNLKQLRLLDLTNTHIQRLPQSISRLYYLQILELTNCPLKELPGGIKSMVSLQILNFQKSFGLCMPHGIGNLIKLRTLPRFDVKRGGLHCALSELKGLVNLRGELLIAGLSNLTSLEEAEEASLHNKSHLEALTLNFSSEPSTPCFHSTQLSSIDVNKELRYAPDSNFQEQVLQTLRPHENLKELHIYKCGGSRFPSWLGDSSFSILATLSLVGGECGYKVLPTLGQLPRLKKLLIRSMRYVRCVGSEFCSGDCAVNGFRSLKTLEFRDMLNWSEWTAVSESAFSSLETLKLVDCPELRVLPERLSSSLIDLVIEIENCGLLKTLPSFPTLTRLSLCREASEDMLSCLDQPTLTSLTISKSRNIRSLHLNKTKIPLLKDLIVKECINLRSIAGISSLGLLETFKISACPNLQISLYEKIPRTLTHLGISNCPKLLNWKKIQYNKHYAQLNVRNDVNNEEEELEQQWFGNPIENMPDEVQSHIRAEDYKGKGKIE